MSTTGWQILAFGTLAGAAIPVGGWLAHIERLRPAWLETEFLYITFQDIAPQARLERHWVPPLGAVLGFMVGLTGHMWLQGTP